MYERGEGGQGRQHTARTTKVLTTGPHARGSGSPRGSMVVSGHFDYYYNHVALLQLNGRSVGIRIPNVSVAEEKRDIWCCRATYVLQGAIDHLVSLVFVIPPCLILFINWTRHMGFHGISYTTTWTSTRPSRHDNSSPQW